MISPVAEMLEPRRMLTVLTATGTIGNDTIGVSVVSGTVRVIVNGILHTMSDATCTGIEINAVGGNDTIGVLNNTNNPTDIDAGPGNDTITLALNDFATITALVTITGGTNTTPTGDTVVVNDTAGTLDGYAISTAGFGNGRDGFASFTGVESFTLNANDLGTPINVLSAGTGTNTINANGGDDDIVLGDAGNRYSAISSIIVNGGAGTDAIRVDDQGQVLTSSFTIVPGSFDSTRGGPTTHSGVESITINGGSGNNAHVVESLAAGTTLTLNCGAGDDSAQVNPGSQLLADIAGTLTINGGGAVNSLTFFDGANFFALSYFITDSTFRSTVMSNPAITYLNCQTMTVNGTTGPASWEVQGSAEDVHLILNGSDDADGFNLNQADNTGSFMNLFGDVTCNGNGGSNVVRLLDRFHTLPTRYDVTNTFLRASSGVPLGPFLVYSACEALLIVTGGAVDDSFAVHSLAASVALTIFATSGTGDSLGLSPSAHDLDAIQGPITFDHQGAGGTTTLFDFENTTPITYTYAPGQPVTRTGFAGLTGFGDFLAIEAGTANDTFQIDGIEANRTIYCTGGDGADSATFGTGLVVGAFAGDASFDGQGGADSLVVNGSTDTVGRGFTYSNGTQFLNGTPRIHDLNTENVTLKTGSGADTVAVINSHPVAIRVETGGGADRVNAIATGAIALTVDAGTGAGDNANILDVDFDGGAPAVVSLASSQSFSQVLLQFSAGVLVGAGGDKLLTVGSLQFSSIAKLDLFDNDLIVTNTPRATIENNIRTAYNFGGWDGASGIFSSSAKDNPLGNTTLGLLSGQEFNDNNGGLFDGRAVNNADVVVKYTYFGDVDFNGSIDASDYNLIDFGFANHLTGWANGDADDSGGATDVSDYNLVDFAFATQTGAL